MINNKINKAKKVLVTLEFLEALEASFILGLVIYLTTVIKLSYMLNLIYTIFIIDCIFLFTSVKGIYKYYAKKIA